jgi:hypothetical protein
LIQKHAHAAVQRQHAKHAQHQEYSTRHHAHADVTERTVKAVVPSWKAHVIVDVPKAQDQPVENVQMVVNSTMSHANVNVQV